MRGGSTLLLATLLTFGGSAVAAPVMPFVADHIPRSPGVAGQSGDGGLVLVQNRGRGGGGASPQRPANAQRSAGANRGGFNSNNFHQNVSNTRNLNANRNTNINANRNVNVSGGGCCYGNYNSGPNWGGVAAGVAVGAMVGAAANSAYAAPPPTYPPGYVTPPPY